MDTDFVMLLNQLRQGELQELTVTPEDFMAFRAAWADFPGRKEIVGTAHRGGTIVYRYTTQFD